MPWPQRSSCRQCLRDEADAGPISARGLCADCGELNVTANLEQLRACNGPYFDHWRRRLLAAFGADH